MSAPLLRFLWKESELGRALFALARRARIPVRPGAEPPATPESVLADPDEALATWLEATASWLSFEAEPYATTYAHFEEALSELGPALIRFSGAGTTGFLLHVGSRRGTSTFLAPDRGEARIATAELVSAFAATLREDAGETIERLLDTARVASKRRARVRRELLRERLAHVVMTGIWVLRPPPNDSFYSRVRRLGLDRSLLFLAGAHAVQYLLWIAGWWMIGAAALEGKLDRGWLFGWALLLFTLIPMRALVTWTQSRLAIALGGLLKQRLLHGALRQEPEEVRKEGVGHLLGRVLESEAIEATAIGGGLAGVLAMIELAAAAILLAAVSPATSVLLAAWVALTAILGYRYSRRVEAWSGARMAMTHDLVERMVGQRTRLAQEAPSRRHAGEDQALASYLEHARAMDRIGPILIALVPKSWLLAGVLSVAPLFVGEVSASAALPAALGGVLLARLAFEKLMLSVASLSRAAIAWKQIRPLFLAAARAELAGAPAAVASALSPETSTGPLLSAHELAFRHRGRSAPVLEGVSLSIARNDRLLLQGPSGGGKSTLASLLSGMRAPDSGLILLGGLDRHTLGEAGWRKRIAHAPQFHENHVFAASFAFNLLMGGRWPAPPRRVAEAEAICRELGLGPLLERMPGGMLQVVGDTGWQLSHGERSRLFIARALLQRAEVLVLDESFAALDPENLRESLKTVLARAPAMVVIAHP